MIEIRVNNEALDLPADLRIRFESPNTILDDDKIGGEYTFPFTIPLTARNKRLLGYVERISLASKPTRSFDSEIIVMGTFHRKGTFYVTKASDTEVQASLMVGVGSIGVIFGDKTLRELDLGTWSTTPGGLYGTAGMITRMNGTIANPYPDDPSNPVIFVPHSKPNHYNYDDVTGGGGSLSPTTVTYTGVMNEYDPVGSTFRVNLLDWTGIIGLNLFIDASPAVWVMFLLDKIAAGIGYKAKGVFHEHPELSTLLLQTTYSTLNFKETYTSSFHDVPLSIQKTMPPELTVAQFIKDLKTLFNVITVPDPANGTLTFSLANDVVTSDPQLDLTSVSDPSYEIEYQTQEIHYFGYELDKSDPDSASVKDVATLNFVGEYGYGPGMPVAVEDDLVLATDVMRWYRGMLAALWRQYGIPWNGYGPDNAGKRHISVVSPVNMAKIKDQATGNFLLVPHNAATGEFNNYNGYFEPSQSWMGRLMFYRGATAGVDTGGNNYPLAQSGNLDINGNPTGDYTLSWYGPSGLYENFWKPWLNSINGSRIVKRIVMLTISQIFGLRMDRRIRIDNVNYIILNMSFEVTHLKVTPVEFTLLTT